MNKSEKINEDALRFYINPEKVEKAPEGFTEKIMTRIQMEKSYSPAGIRRIRNFNIPAIYLLITVILIITAIVVSAGNTDSAFYSLFKPVSDLKLSFPEFSFDTFSGFSMPGWLIYLALGIFFLSLFDRILNTLFSRHRK